MRKKQSGFSFLELAVAMFIMTLLLGSILVPLATQVEQRQISETTRMLEEARDALLGHAIAHGRLPCADTDGDGDEDTGGACSAGSISHGLLPWQTLGLAASDAWGNRIRYAVQGDYAVSISIGSPPGNMPRVCESSTNCLTTILTSSAVAVLLSHGKNGYGATNVGGSVYAAPTTADELENTDADRDFVSRTRTAVDTTAGEFDDVVIWLPLYTLFNRMVTAGKLP